MLKADIQLRLSRLDLDAEFTVESGEVVALLGPNGSGKSTTLRALMGLLPLAGGQTVLDGTVLEDPAQHIRVPPESRPIGLMFQDYLLFPHLSAVENVAFGLRAKGTDKKVARERATQALARLGLEGALTSARPSAMSGGQQQRVAMARALVTEPKLLLLDEPLAALDVSTKTDVRRLLREALRQSEAANVLSRSCRVPTCSSRSLTISLSRCSWPGRWPGPAAGRRRCCRRRPAACRPGCPSGNRAIFGPILPRLRALRLTCPECRAYLVRRPDLRRDRLGRGTLLHVAIERRQFLLLAGAAATGAGLAGCTSARSASEPPASTAPRSSAPQPSPSASPSGDASRPLGPQVVHGPRNRSRVALTFHGQGPLSIAQALLAEAERAHARVTVLAVGTWLVQYPQIARRILGGGHDLGNHTMHHLDIAAMDASAAYAEIAGCAQRLRTLTGSAGRWFRPSQTHYATPLIEREARRAGYQTCVSYDVDSLDYTDPGPDAVVSTVLGQARPGSIVSLHFGHSGTVTALPAILHGLARRGLRPVTLTSLLSA